MRRIVFVGTVVVGLGLAWACRNPPAPARPPIVFISIDTLRSDWLPTYGGLRVDTPAIEALARDGLVFERAFAEVPLTLPSHLSVFTGQLPPVHGVRDNVGFPVDGVRNPMLQARLRQLGYSTMGAVSALVLGQRSGFAAGFDRWDEPQATAADNSSEITAERPGSAAIAAARGWLADLPQTPWFLFVHLYEPHLPYRPPEALRARYGNTYGAEIAAADLLVGELIADLRTRGLYDQALIVLFSDHGEGLGDHGEDEHGLLLYREVLQVPLLVKLPQSARAGERIARNVGLIDIAPTILEVLSEPAEGLPGLSLLRQEPTPQRVLYAETMYPMLHFGWSDLASAIAGDLQLIDGPEPELYDFANDPAETRDLVGDDAVDRRLLAAMRTYLGGVDRSIAAPEQVAAETIATLGALGYVGQPSLPDDRTNLPNPMERASTVRPLLAGMRLYHEGAYEQAIVALSEAVQAPDLQAHAYQFLGASYEALGRQEEALEAYQRGSAVTGSSSFLAENAARRLLELGRPQAALEMLEGEAKRFPQSVMLAVFASRALLQLGRLDEAKLAADRAVALGPELGDAFYQRAVVALGRRDGPAAVPDLVRAAALDPKHLGARKALAMLRYAQGDTAEAKRLLEEVLAIDPRDPDALADVATLTAEQAGKG